MSLTKHQKAILSTLTTGSHKIAYDKQYDCWELKTISTRFGYDRFLQKVRFTGCKMQAQSALSLPTINTCILSKTRLSTLIDTAEGSKQSTLVRVQVDLAG